MRILNIAATATSTHALGPGRRAVAWVQGCPFNCRGCVAPDWIPDRPAERHTARELADLLLADPDVVGFTFSGGEPMQQAHGLADTIALARRERDLSLICFTGYRLERLRVMPPSDGVSRLLDEVDVLIDGRYVQSLNDDLGLRGSSNQRVHHITNRLSESGFDFERRPRDVEIRLSSDSVQMVGVPNRVTAVALDLIVTRPSGTPPKRSER